MQGDQDADDNGDAVADVNADNDVGGGNLEEGDAVGEARFYNSSCPFAEEANMWNFEL